LLKLHFAIILTHLYSDKLKNIFFGEFCKRLLIDSLKIHYVGSVKLSEFKSLAEISNKDPRFVTSTSVGLESTKSFRVRKKAYGKYRYLVVTYNQKLFDTQILTVYNDIEKAVEKLEALEQKLNDRDSGLITKGRSPTVSSVQSQCKDILSRQYMKDIMKYSVSSGLNGIPQLEYEIDTEALERLSDTYLGKNIIVTNRSSWGNEQVILAYRSQFNIENVFKEMKDRDIGSWWPLFHWTEQKIQIHSFYCTIAILLRALALRRVKNAGIQISMKRMLNELDDVKEVILIYPNRRGTKKNSSCTVLSKTSELQQKLLSVLSSDEQNTPS
jgi:transposase